MFGLDRLGRLGGRRSRSDRLGHNWLGRADFWNFYFYGWHFGGRGFGCHFRRRGLGLLDNSDRFRRRDRDWRRNWNCGFEMPFEIFCGDFVQRTGGHARGADAKFLRLSKDLLAFDPQFFRNVVNTNGHNFVLTPSCWTKPSSYADRDNDDLHTNIPLKPG